MGKKASFQKVEQQQQKRSFCPFFFRPPKVVRRKNEWTRGVKKTKRGGGRRRRRGVALTRRSKNVPIVGIVVTISPSLSLYKMVVLPAASRPTCVRFPRETKRTNLFGQYTQERNSASNRPTLTRMHSTLSKRRTRPRDEARRPMFHRIGSPRIRRKKSPLPFRPVGALRPPLFARRAIQNPIRSLIIIIENAGLFDLTTRVIPSKKRARSLPTRDTTLKPRI